MPVNDGKFSPQPNEELTIQRQRYTVEPNARAVGNAYRAMGKRANVYRLRKPDDSKYALKVFRQKYAEPSLVSSAGIAARYQNLPGMLAASRVVLGPKDDAVLKCDELLYSSLMPWIGGTTWNDVLVQAEKHLPIYTPEIALSLCRQFLTVMAALGQEGVAHTDIAPGNVVVGLKQSGTRFDWAGNCDVQLIDLEDLYVSGLPVPKVKNTGTEGYRHISADRSKSDTWEVAGDRYATAIMATEMLLLGSSRPVRQSFEYGVFGGNPALDSALRQMDHCLPYLRSISGSFAACVQKAWASTTLMDCPEASELLAALPQASSVPPPQPPPSRPNPVTQSQDGLPPIIWGNPIAPRHSQSSRTNAARSAASTSQPTPPAPSQPSPAAPFTPPYGATSVSQGAGSGSGSVQVPLPSGAPVVWANARSSQAGTPVAVASPAASSSRRSSSGTPAGAIWAIVILILIVIAVIIFVVIANKQEQDQKAAEERQHYWAEQKAQRQRQIASQSSDFDKHTTYFTSRTEDLQPYANFIAIKNSCKSTAVNVAVRFQMPDGNHRWVTMGWFRVEASTSYTLPLVTQGGRAYIYASPTDTTGSWAGDGKSDSADASVPDDHTLHFIDDPSYATDDLPSSSVKMFPLQMGTWGTHTQQLVCDKSQ